MKPNAALGTLWMITILSGSILLLPKAEAESPDTTKTSLSVEIEASCTLSSQETSSHTASIIPGGIASDIGSTTINAVCNDPYGFDIYAVGYGNDTEGDTNMHSSTYTIPTGTTFSGNTSAWAMKIGTTGNPSSPYTPIIDYASDYSVIPSTATRVAHVATNTDASSESSITTTYKVYASPEQKVGTYIGKVKYNISHPYVPPVTVLAMQDVADWGSSVALNESIQAVDKRDNKMYWVTRICQVKENGNCTNSQLWMTQNLDYDLSIDANKSLKADTSDVSADRTLTITSRWGTSDTALYYYNGGDYYIANGNTRTKKTAPDLTTDAAKGDTNLHYHLGSYYSWNAATASTSTSNTQYANASGSICPKGWHLPRDFNGNSTRLTTGFSYLLYTNGIISSPTSTSWASNGFKNINKAPLYFANTDTYFNDNKLTNLGSYGYYWSSTVGSYSYAYSLSFDSSNVLPTSNSYYLGSLVNLSYGGFSVRCVSTQ